METGTTNHALDVDSSAKSVTMAIISTKNITAKKNLLTVPLWMITKIATNVQPGII